MTISACRRPAFTLVELIVVIAIILVIAMLAAAFAPRVNDSANLTRAVDNLEQWLLTAKMRAKRDGVATGVRFIQMPGDPTGTYSQLQYIQQPDPFSGVPGGATLVSASNGTVTFSGVDFTLGGTTGLTQALVAPGDYLEVRGGAVYYIAAVTGATTLQIGDSSTDDYANKLNIIQATATSNFRILRQPRLLIGEEPLALPNNFAVDMRIIPDAIIPGNSTALAHGKIPVYWSNVARGPSGYAEILFAPTGAVVGANAGSGRLLLSVYDQTMTPFDIHRLGIVGVQCRTGFIGAYSTAPGAGAAGYDPFLFAEEGRESGL